MKWNYRILLLFFCLFPGAFYAQKPVAFIEAGDAFAERGEWEEAYAYYAEAYKRDSSTFDHVVKMAEAARMLKEYDYALRLYREAYSRDGGKLFPESLFYLAQLEKMTGDYDSAQRDFKKYTKKLNRDKQSYLYKKAMAETESCIWAMQYKHKESGKEVTRLKYDSDQGSENFSWAFGDTLLFSEYDAEQNAWSVASGVWSDSTLQGIRDVPGKNMANVCFDAQGYAYFTRCRNGECSIWRTAEPGMAWDSSAPLLTIHREGYQTTMPFIAIVDGKECIFFCSNRPGTKGKMDIWYAYRSGDTFINPENAGDIINTADDELSPFYKDGFLYFSSEWHKGFGGQDIFRLKGSPGIWGIPENLGAGINSSYNDIFYREISDTLAFFSSNRPVDKGSVTCCNDLYTVREKKKNDQQQAGSSIVKYPTFEELNRILPVTLYFHNDEPNPRSVDTTTQVLYSEAYTSYESRIDEYRNERSKGLDGEKKEDAVAEVNDFFEFTVKKGMNDLQLFAALLLKELETGNSIHLSIRGFASPRARSDYNKKLTQRRIQSLINELKAINGGALQPYIEGTAMDGTLLRFEALPFGEDKSDKTVVDALENTRESVYSRSARLERKIEIQAVEGFSARSIVADSDYHNFGKIGSREVVYHSFILENASDKTVKIDSVLASCGCTEPQLMKDFLFPGEQTELKVGYDPHGASGREIKQVMIYVAGEKPRILMIEAEVKGEE